MKISDLRTVGHISNRVFDPAKLLTADEHSSWEVKIVGILTRGLRFSMSLPESSAVLRTTGMCLGLSPSPRDDMAPGFWTSCAEVI